MKTAPDINEFAALLGIRTGHQNTAAWVDSRLCKLGLGSTCGRCGGSGSYSFCAAFGSTCFKCHGVGSLPRKHTAKLYAEAQAKVADGSNAAIIEENRSKVAAKNCVDGVMTAWNAADKLNPYNWRKASESPLHHRAADFNKIMADLFSATTHARSMLNGAETTVRHSPDLSKIEAAKAEIPALRAALLKSAADAVAGIAAVSADVAAWRATLSADELAELSAHIKK